MKVPVVGIDLDGVLVEFNKVMLRVLSSYTGVDYSTSDVTDYDYSKCLEGVTPEIVKSAFSETINTPSFWVRLASVSEDTVVAARSLSDISHLYAITARSENRLAEAKYQTTLDQSHSWLQTRKISCAGVVRCDDGSDKPGIVEALNCDYFLDDQPKAFLLCMDSGINAYLLDAPYNQEVDCRGRRLYSVREYLELVREDIQ